MGCIVSYGSTSFLWLVFFFGALLWGSMIHKHTGRWMCQGSAPPLFLNYATRNLGAGGGSLPDTISNLFFHDITVYVWQKPTELAHPFLFRSCVCFCLHDPFNYKFSVFLLCSSSLIFALLVPLTRYLFMKDSFSPDIPPSGWLGSKHQLTNIYLFAVVLDYTNMTIFFQIHSHILSLILQTGTPSAWHTCGEGCESLIIYILHC